MSCFLFEPGTWVGEGQISFNPSSEKLRFMTTWTVNKKDGDRIVCMQTVEMQGVHDRVHNRLTISEITKKSFKIELENELIGHISGNGVFDEKSIAWEFRNHPGFEGFEVYHLREDKGYTLHAEYASVDQYRTIIDGRIWKKDTIF